MNIIVYGKPDCTQCFATKKLMTRLGLAHEYRDITDDKEAENTVRETGYTMLPVVMVRNGVHSESWCGFRETKIRALVSGNGK